MATNIVLKRSSSSGATPSTSDLELGEIALNTYDGKMYMKKTVSGTSSIVELTGNVALSSSAFDLINYKFVASSNQTTFTGSDANSVTLAYATGTIQVFLNGILLDPTDYTATNGSSVVLDTGATSGDILYISRFAGVNPFDDFKYVADANQTTFTGSDANSETLIYTVGNLAVYLNGVLLDPTDFTATNGSSVVLASGAAAGDILHIHEFNQTGLTEVHADTTPTLGGDLDLHTYDLVTTDNRNIDIIPHGTGDVNLSTDTVKIGASGENVIVTTNGTGDITLSTNAGTNSGTVKILDGANQNIEITPNGSGKINLDGLLWPNADGSANQFIQTDGSGNLSFVDVLDTAEEIADTVGAMVGSNTETGITVTYQDSDNTLDFALAAAQTTITSLLAADIKIGEDDQTKIDFETADEIHFYAANAHQIKLVDGALVPVTDNDIDLGTSSLEFKDAFFDGTVTSDAFAGPLTGNVTGNVSGTALTVTQAAQTAITSVGTLTGLTGGTGDLVWDSPTFVVDSSANSVGIGTTSIDNNAKLHIEDSAYPIINLDRSSLSADGNHLGYINFQNNGDVYGYIGAWVEDLSETDGELRFATQKGTSITDKMVITSDGLVGIGTASPADYNSHAENLVVASSGNTGISIVAGTSNDSTILFADGTGGTAGYRGRIGYDHATDNMVFHTAAATRMQIDADGTIQLGNPATGAATNVVVMPTGKLFLDAGGNTYIHESSGDVVDFITGGTQRLRLNSSGVTASAATVTTSAKITEAPLTDGSTAVDAAAQQNCTLVLQENTTIGEPSNSVAGQVLVFEIAQHASSGPYTLQWDENFVFAGGTTPTMTATDNMTDIFTFRYNGEVWQEIGRSQNMVVDHA